MPIWLAILIAALIVAIAIRPQLLQVLGSVAGGAAVLVLSMVGVVAFGALLYVLCHHIVSPDPEDSIPIGTGLLLILIIFGPLSVWGLARESQAGAAALRRWRPFGILALVGVIAAMLLAGAVPKSWAAAWFVGLAAVSLGIYSLGTCWSWRKNLRHKRREIVSAGESQ